LLLPVTIVVELLAAFPRVPRWLILPLRGAVATSAAGILLYGSSYLSDIAGPGTREWSPVQAWLILGGLAIALAGVWTLMEQLSHRAPGAAHAVCLAGTSAGAALTVMLSGYATGGQIGVPLAAALLGAMAAALVLRRTPKAIGPLGVPIVALFSLLVIGHFFGELTWLHASVLFFAPLLGWLPELPLLRRMPPWARGLSRVVLVAAVVSAVVVHAQTKFVEASNMAPGSEPAEVPVQDAIDYGR
jgi:hypothetical protein